MALPVASTVSTLSKKFLGSNCPVKGELSTCERQHVTNKSDMATCKVFTYACETQQYESRKVLWMRSEGLLHVEWVKGDTTDEIWGLVPRGMSQGRHYGWDLRAYGLVLCGMSQGRWMRSEGLFQVEWVKWDSKAEIWGLMGLPHVEWIKGDTMDDWGNLDGYWTSNQWYVETTVTHFRHCP